MKKSKLAPLFLLFIFTFNLLMPSAAYARLRLRPKKFFRFLKRKVNYVVNIPDKATRWMGPVLGPIAADVLTQNIGRNPRIGRLFRRARKTNNFINNIEQQKKLLNEYRQIYQDEAKDLRKKANEIDKIRKDFATQVVKGDISFDDFKKKVANLEKIKASYQDAADKFDNHANRMNEGRIVKMVTKAVLNQTVNQVKDAVIFETTKEISKLINPDIIKSFVSGDGLSQGNLLDLLISSDISKFKKGGNLGDIDIDKLRQNIKNSIKDILKENKNAFKNGWANQIRELVEQEAQKLKDEKNKLENPETPKANPTEKSESKKYEDDNDSELDEFLELEADDNDPTKCKPGYVYKPRTGRGCVQEDCYNGDIPNAHLSYDGDCVCGSSGSINENPDDPNKECYYDRNYKSCPSCVFSCIGIKDECPEKP